MKNQKLITETKQEIDHRLRTKRILEGLAKQIQRSLNECQNRLKIESDNLEELRLGLQELLNTESDKQVDNF